MVVYLIPFHNQFYVYTKLIFKLSKRNNINILHYIISKHAAIFKQGQL